MSQSSTFPRAGVMLLISTVLIGALSLYVFGQRESIFSIRLADNQDQLLPQLHQIMELPNLEPKIVTVQETDTITQSFPEIASDVRPNMIIISYPNQTILYNPETRKIVKSVSYYLPQPLKISIRHSVGQEARAKQFLAEFKNAPSLYQVVETTASAQIYNGDVAIVNNEQRIEEIKVLNQLIGNGPLLTKQESSESASPADMYIIFGRP